MARPFISLLAITLYCMCIAIVGYIFAMKEKKARNRKSASIENAIKEAQWILKINPDGDKQHRSRTLNRAAKLLRDNCNGLPAPDIGPGPDGSIDLYWNLPNIELLINVPDIGNGENFMSFYADGKGIKSLKGFIDDASAKYLLYWFKGLSK